MRMPGLCTAARLEDRQLRAAVDVEVGLRVGHRVHVARLPGEVEQEILPAHQARQPRPVAHVRDMHAHAAGDPREVAAVAAIFRDQAVHDRDLGAERDQRPREIRADEAQPAVISTRFPV
jgi:hypothetical protein